MVWKDELLWCVFLGVRCWYWSLRGCGVCSLKEGMVQDVSQLGWVGCVSDVCRCGGEGVAIPGEMHNVFKG